MNTDQPMSQWRPQNLSEPLKPQFPTMPEVEIWFEDKFCGMDHVAIIPPSAPQARAEYPMPRLASIAEAVAPRRARKSDWLRRDGNEEWYGPRLALVQSLWNELKSRHDEIVGDLNTKHTSLQNEMAVMKEKHLAELAAANDEYDRVAKDYASLKRNLASIESMVQRLVDLKVRTGRRIICQLQSLTLSLLG